MGAWPGFGMGAKRSSAPVNHATSEKSPGIAGSPLPCGRFAPTPSGPLHFGSLVAALASALDMKSRGGRWFVRIDDIDRGRAVPGAADRILSTLERLGFEWDGAVQYQQPRIEHYRRAAEKLRAAGYAFDCACSRREVNAAGIAGLEGPIYPGTCRSGLLSGRSARSIRLRSLAAPIAFADEWQGRIEQNLARDIGDFVIWRADDIPAYHLACVLDDAELGITRVVRGLDLLLSTPRQILLQRLLGLPTPAYAHHPLVMKNDRKLGKRTRAQEVSTHAPARTLARALEFLNQAPPPDLVTAALTDVWRWAVAHWAHRPFFCLDAPGPSCHSSTTRAKT